MTNLLASRLHSRKFFFVCGLVVIGILLSFLAYTNQTKPEDTYIADLFRQLPYPTLFPFMAFISFFGYIPGLLLSLFVIISLCCIYKHYALGCFFLLPLGAIPIDYIIKLLIHRPRPGLETALFSARFGFPSDHVTQYTVLYGFLVYILLKKHPFPTAIALPLGTLAVILVLFVGVWRIFLGVHWFTDVLGGYILGILLLLFVITLYHRLLDPQV